jgi:hypothetical protein
LPELQYAHGFGKNRTRHAEKVMRHSDVRLTMETYTDSQMLPLPQ